jgi:hypothetical protein
VATLNKKYVDYLHQQRTKGKEMPPPKNRKRALNAHLFNEPLNPEVAENCTTKDVKDFLEYKKFKQEKNNQINLRKRWKLRIRLQLSSLFSLQRILELITNLDQIVF